MTRHYNDWNIPATGCLAILETLPFKRKLTLLSERESVTRSSLARLSTLPMIDLLTRHVAAARRATLRKTVAAREDSERY